MSTGSLYYLLSFFSTAKATHNNEIIYFSEKELEEETDTTNSEQPEIVNGEAVESNTNKCLDEIFDNHSRALLGPRDENRADRVNFRYLLWKAMASFPEVAEQKSRDVVPLFLSFVR